MQYVVSEGGILKATFSLCYIILIFLLFFFRLCPLIYHGSLKNRLNVHEYLICKEANPLFIDPPTDLIFLNL